MVVSLFKEYVKENYINTIEPKDEDIMNDSLINGMFLKGMLTNEPKDTSQLTKVLIVSHGGFIQELLNNFIWLVNGHILEHYHTKNTSMYVIKVFCPKCEKKCNNQNHTKLQVSFSVFNDYHI